MSEDRNEKARREFAEAQANNRRNKEMAAARQQFAQAVQAGQAAVFDDVGHRLAPGQLVIFNPPVNVWRWLIKDVVPVLDPNVQPGAMRVLLTLDVPLNVLSGQRFSNMLVVGEQEVAAEPQPQPEAEAVEEPIADVCDNRHGQPSCEDPECWLHKIATAAPPAASPDATGHSDD